MVEKKKLPDRRVRVYSEVGVTIPIDDTTAHIRFLFGHERFAKNDTQEELKKTAAQVDEFNEAELERRVKKYQRLVRQINAEEDEEPKNARRRSSRRR